ncbi:HIT domain-containing protein [Buchnera aphidicola]|uniref:HIT domain-containing protein n=1 Tax=Buchnera aphidicola TaxID=9 RepID=UPI003D18D565
MVNNIFKKIINKEIKSNILYQDNILTAFEDINPKTPVHILIVPNIFIKNTNYITQNNKYIFGEMFLLAKKLAKKFKINKTGYKLIINCGKNGGQEVKYLHMHLLGGVKIKSIV